MFVAMGRDGIGCSSQFDLLCSFDHYALSGLDASNNLYVAPIVSTRGDELLAIALFIELDEDEAATLLLDQGCFGQDEGSIDGRADEPHLAEGTGHDVAAVVELEGDGQVVAVASSCFAVGEQAPVEFIQGVSLLVGSRAEVGRAQGNGFG